MPHIADSGYKAPLWLPGGHAQSIFPSLFRNVAHLPYARTRITTPDRDFLDLDILTCGLKPPKGAVILSHGLEGDSRRKYIRGMALLFADFGWDSVAWNFRGCSGEMNHGPGMYHSGQTGDLRLVVEHCRAAGYRRLLLIGFSMGGNQILKYLGEAPEEVPSEVIGAAAFSVPCDLTASARVLDQPGNALYLYRFLRTLRQKVRIKHERFPEYYPLEGLEGIRSFKEFDGRYTAPVHGFASAEDYWSRSSCLPFLRSIRVKTLLVNALNDPFLAPSCFPFAMARQHPLLSLETPKAGGHVGFTTPLGISAYWSELRAAEFFQEELA